MPLEEVKNYLRVDIDDDDLLITNCYKAAVAYLENATGWKYHEKDEKGVKIDCELEKVFILQLVADMYEKRTPAVGKNVGFVYNSIILQLQLKHDDAEED